MMNSEAGLRPPHARGALEECNVSFEYMPSGIDTMTVLVSDHNIEGRIDQVVEKIRRTCKARPHRGHQRPFADRDRFGRGMVRLSRYRRAHLRRAGRQSGINIRTIDQGSSEINITGRVESADLLKKAINAHLPILPS